MGKGHQSGLLCWHCALSLSQYWEGIRVIAFCMWEQQFEEMPTLSHCIAMGTHRKASPSLAPPPATDISSRSHPDCAHPIVPARPSLRVIENVSVGKSIINIYSFSISFAPISCMTAKLIECGHSGSWWERDETTNWWKVGNLGTFEWFSKVPSTIDLISTETFSEKIKSCTTVAWWTVTQVFIEGLKLPAVSQGYRGSFFCTPISYILPSYAIPSDKTYPPEWCISFWHPHRDYEKFFFGCCWCLDSRVKCLMGRFCDLCNWIK